MVPPWSRLSVAAAPGRRSALCPTAECLAVLAFPFITRSSPSNLFDFPDDKEAGATASNAAAKPAAPSAPGRVAKAESFWKVVGILNGINGGDRESHYHPTQDALPPKHKCCATLVPPTLHKVYYQATGASYSVPGEFYGAPMRAGLGVDRPAHLRHETSVAGWSHNWARNVRVLDRSSAPKAPKARPRRAELWPAARRVSPRQLAARVLRRLRGISPCGSPPTHTYTRRPCIL